MSTRWSTTLIILLTLILVWTVGYKQAQSQAEPPNQPAVTTQTAFTYQGSLKQNDVPINDNCDFKVGLWSATATQLGITQTLTMTVTNGLFSLKLNGAGEFGTSAYYVGKKLCACLYEQGVGVKLPEQSAAKLLEVDQNVVPFQPLGKRKMREWIQINLSSSEDYRQYKSVFDESIRHVLAQQEKGKA
jgi:hypothetical protein